MAWNRVRYGGLVVSFLLIKGREGKGREGKGGI